MNRIKIVYANKEYAPNGQRIYKVGDEVGFYRILRRLPRLSRRSRQTRFLVKCLNCGYEMKRYPNKFKIAHYPLCGIESEAIRKVRV